MATQQPSLVNLYDYKYGWGNTNALSLVKDSYSGKYYGSDSYDKVVSSLNRASAYYKDIISRAESNTYESLSLKETPSTLSQVMGGGKTLSPYDEAKLALSGISSNPIEASSYVQKPQMIESFNANPDGWNKYFESSYKTPRLAEDNAQAAQQNAKSNQGGRATGNQQLVSSNLEIRKEVGTGVGKESVGLNPFGKLDAGLNI